MWKTSGDLGKELSWGSKGWNPETLLYCLFRTVSTLGMRFCGEKLWKRIKNFIDTSQGFIYLYKQNPILDIFWQRHRKLYYGGVGWGGGEGWGGGGGWVKMFATMVGWQRKILKLHWLKCPSKTSRFFCRKSQANKN